MAKKKINTEPISHTKIRRKSGRTKFDVMID